MAPAQRLRQLPGYFAFNAGVMFFIGLASRLASAEPPAFDAAHTQMLGAAILFALLAMASGFGAAARIEFSKRDGGAHSIGWIVPPLLIGLPLGRAVAEGEFGRLAFAGPALGASVALAGLAWLMLRARREVKA